MSVILECRTGDEIVCIMEFQVSPDGEAFSWESSRKIQVGERLRFVEGRQDAHFRDGPNGWLVCFETADGKRYTATQGYFVTDECWQGLEQHFCRSGVQV